MRKTRCLSCRRRIGQQKGSYGSGGWGGRDKGRPCGPRRCAEQGINPHAPEHVKGRREKLAEGRRIVAGLGPGWVADVFYNLQWCCIVRFHDHIEGKDFSVSSSYGGGYHALYSPWSATGGTPRAAVDAVVRQAEGYARSVARMAVLIQLAAKRARGRAA